MAATSAWWIDRVLPHVATRQWVVTVPWKRRWLLARRPELASGVHTVDGIYTRGADDRARAPSV